MIATRKGAAAATPVLATVTLTCAVVTPCSGSNSTIPVGGLTVMLLSTRFDTAGVGLGNEVEVAEGGGSPTVVAVGGMVGIANAVWVARITVAVN